MHAVLAAIVLFSAGGAWAADDAAPASDPATARYSPAYDRCLEAPGGSSTNGMIDCAYGELKVQDAALNAKYRKVMSDLNPRQQAKLRAAQRAWLTFRDAECASYEDDDWGTISRNLAADCVLHMTVMRLINLENYPPGG